MYRCLDCDSIFDEHESDTVEEYMGDYGSAPAYETWSACPFCNSTDLELFDPDLELDDEFEEDYDDDLLVAEIVALEES